MVRWIAMLCVIAVMGCVVHKRTVMPVDLAREAKTFVAQGRATVIAAEGTVDVSADELAFVHLRETKDSSLETPTKLTVRRLVEGCVADIDAEGCLAGRTASEPAMTKRSYEFSGSRLATTISFGAIGAFVGGCIAECKDSGGLEKGATYVGIGAAVFVGMFLLIAVVGGR
jgi:hypothetical protein